MTLFSLLTDPPRNKSIDLQLLAHFAPEDSGLSGKDVACNVPTPHPLRSFVMEG